MATLKVQILRPELASLPEYATEGSAGLDLRAAIPEPLSLPPGGSVKVPTGIAVALPPGHEGQVRPRSGLAFRHGITVLNAPGTIDEDYRGEVAVLLVNHGKENHLIQPQDRIAQMVVAPVTRVTIQTIDSSEDLGSTARGEGGFGSTGR